MVLYLSLSVNLLQASTCKLVKFGVQANTFDVESKFLGWFFEPELRGKSHTNSCPNLVGG